ncbi:uncharacterized protein P884DRAFT_188475 [Thermothelomyces heterothallicus CBS 202.75]|uniref:uncharacterized protein n=1 Tax=Thermothelomyces heterothallicus CBS 202.75 TaxID=1149848 RepID=UPI003744501F
MAKSRGLVRHAVKAKQKTGHQDEIKGSNKKNKTANGRQQKNQQPTIPFAPSDRILLVGEGDLSFAASLITHHHCTNVTATVLEPNFAELSAKYPHVSANTAVIESPDHPNCRLLYGIDARKLPPFTSRPNTTTTTNKNNHNRSKGKPEHEPPVGAMKRIIFNFPHTGGKSKDVNRQVRYNQELLVDFFRRAQLSLAPGGTIIVTLFEGEPYTLWNIRDLARHAGLQVERSFRFVAAAYPGYGHARTLGVVRNRRGEVATSAWKGEDRPARSYVFVRKGETSDEAPVGAKKRKRGGESSSDDDDDEDDEDDGGGEAGEDEDDNDNDNDNDNDDDDDNNNNNQEREQEGAREGEGSEDSDEGAEIEEEDKKEEGNQQDDNGAKDDDEGDEVKPDAGQGLSDGD